MGLHLNFKFYTIVEKGLKLKVRKFRGLISAFVEVAGEKLIVGLFAPPAVIMNRVKQHSRNNSLKELRKLFLCPPQKIGESTTKILKLLFFTINLDFIGKLIWPLTSSIYFVFLPLRHEQTKYTTCFLTWISCLDECFFILCDKWKTLFFMKVCSFSETFEEPCCWFLSKQCFERSPHFMGYLHNNNMMLITN